MVSNTVPGPALKADMLQLLYIYVNLCRNFRVNDGGLAIERDPVFPKKLSFSCFNNRDGQQTDDKKVEHRTTSCRLTDELSRSLG